MVEEKVSSAENSPSDNVIPISESEGSADEKGEIETLEQMKKENNEMEAELKKKEELIKKRDELRARQAISGKSISQAPPKKKEISPKEYAAGLLRGEILND